MRNLIISYTVLSLLSIGSVAAQNVIPKNFDSLISNIMKENKLPGLSIAIIKGDSIVFAKGFGVRKICESDPVNQHTLFQAASITKTFTATVMGILVEQGKINWDDPVKKYITDFKLIENYVTERLTIRDLLAMRAGVIAGDTIQANNRKELIYLLRKQPLSDSFRIVQTSWNLMYTIAGYIEEIIYRSTWEEIVQNEIFVPLEMKDTYTNIQHSLRFTNNIAVPHLIKNERIMPTNWADFELYAPAECIVTNILDLSKWVRLLLNQGKYDNTSIIKSETLNQIQNPQMIVGDFFKSIFNPTTNFMTFGLGWLVSDYKGNKVIEMGGSAPGTSNLIAMIPSENIGIVIQTNLDFAFAPLVQIKFHVFDHFLLAESK